MIESQHCSKCDHVTTPYYARCPRCEGDRNREKVDQLAVVIRALKATVEVQVSENEMDYLRAQLIRLDHPDPKGLMSWIDEARANQGQGRKRR